MSLTSPHDLALAYDRYASALWRGEDAAAQAFATWLDGYWADEGPVELADHPYVVSVLGGGGAGIRWYARGKTIVGYVGSRRRGCYQVPVDATLPRIYPPERPLRAEKAPERLRTFGKDQPATWDRPGY